MFVSFLYVRYIPSFGEHQYSYRFCITDDDFEEKIDLADKTWGCLLAAVEDIYRARKLPVAANIAKLVAYMSRAYEKDCVDAVMYHIGKDADLKDAVDKCLVLL